MIDKLEKKFGKYAIRGLMRFIIALYAIGFLIELMAPGFYSEWMMLDIDKLLQGQVWRILTFIIQPVDPDNIFRLLITMFVYFFLGTMLEGIWGSFRFNVYYFSGILFNILAVVIIYMIYKVSYPIDFTYLNLTLFLAFAVTFPETRMGFGRTDNPSSMIFLVVYLMAVGVDTYYAFQGGFEEGIMSLMISLVWIGILCLSPKAKYLAIAYAVLLGVDIFRAYRYSVAMGNVTLIVILCAMLNFIIFYLSFRKHGLGNRNPVLKAFQKAMRESQARSGAAGHRPVRNANAVHGKITPLHPEKTSARHRCAICGRTEKDDDSLEFRFCSKCNGNYEYCSDHLYTHTHIE